jgi:hypothetical protein
MVRAILSVLMLAIAKIICDGIKPLNAIGHFPKAMRAGGCSRVSRWAGTPTL